MTPTNVPREVSFMEMGLMDVSSMMKMRKYANGIHHHRSELTKKVLNKNTKDGWKDKMKNRLDQTSHREEDIKGKKGTTEESSH
jgi:hypothetical protein